MPQPKSSGSSSSRKSPPASSRAKSPQAAKRSTARKPAASARKPAAAKRTGTAKRSTTARPTATSKATAERQAAAEQSSLAAVRERLSRGVVVTAESIQEALDDAVERGRVTRADAQSLAEDIVNRGRKQAQDFLADVEQLLGRGRSGMDTAGDRVLREVDRARRAAGVGSFPILGFDGLTAEQVTGRLGDLSPAELRKVRDYEKRHANRKSVLVVIERRLG
jgi:polyhydroxyalkanoate synthesis regulator phasin